MNVCSNGLIFVVFLTSTKFADKHALRNFRNMQPRKVVSNSAELLYIFICFNFFLRIISCFVLFTYALDNPFLLHFLLL